MTLWLIDPDTGAKRAILEDNGIQAVADGAAWIGAVNNADPAPPEDASNRPDLDLHG